MAEMIILLQSKGTKSDLGLFTFLPIKTNPLFSHSSKNNFDFPIIVFYLVPFLIQLKGVSLKSFALGYNSHALLLVISIVYEPDRKNVS